MEELNLQAREVYRLMTGYYSEEYETPYREWVKSEVRQGNMGGEIGDEIFMLRCILGNHFGIPSEDTMWIALLEAWERREEYMCTKMFAYGRTLPPGLPVPDDVPD